MDTSRLALLATPRGSVWLSRSEDVPALDPSLCARLSAAFEAGPGAGLLHLGAAEVGQAMPKSWGWWCRFSGRFLTRVCRHGAGAGEPVLSPSVDADELQELIDAAPLMAGGEYLSVPLLVGLWGALSDALIATLAETGASVGDYLHAQNSAWNQVGRVHFNLAENRRDEEFPFAFMATYTDRLSAHGTAQHLPLGRALREYAGAANRPDLLSLLLPVQRASATCGWLDDMVEAGEIFHPLRWSAGEALQLLEDLELLEQAGVVVRTPAGWRGGRPGKVVVQGTIGADVPSQVGAAALLDFRVGLALDGEPLSEEEAMEILANTNGLALIRGQWVQLDAERLSRELARLRAVQDAAETGGLPFAQAARMLAGAGIDGDGPADPADVAWSTMVAGPWMADLLRSLRSPAALAAVDPGRALQGTLREYQEVGVRWLHLLVGLGLGACLADDMGLGKTIQVLALLAVRKGEARMPHRPSLLVGPASLLANWQAECGRFTPGLRVFVAHSSVHKSADLQARAADSCAGADLVLTSYASLLRYPWLCASAWDLVILDEAQAIKNPATKQTRAAKKLVARSRVVLTGTPIENRLTDLWSLFDFLNPGLLGSAKRFATYSKAVGRDDGVGYGALRQLVAPYILRRLKTDRSVISDLPDKVEVKAWYALSRKQAALYQRGVRELGNSLATTSGMKRRGLVLASLTRLKQICNHPSQWLGDGRWAEKDSGKWMRLRQLAETAAARQEKMLVFTQYREVIAPLDAFLGSIFGRRGLVLHGRTRVNRRQELVDTFQRDDGVPYFILSLKAGGSGLNLTAASHVVHFDRWWNPAVEDQATDRAFRIGQIRNVLVHKFICRGTVEEKIDALIDSKRELSDGVLGGGAGVKLTEMSDDELLSMVALDLNTAIGE